LHNLLVIGEAARCLPASIKEPHPEIDWIAINGLLNRIAHEYLGSPPSRRAAGGLAGD
jgi:uncharacterized protein with HEPN domain